MTKEYWVAINVRVAADSPDAAYLIVEGHPVFKEAFRLAPIADDAIRHISIEEEPEEVPE